MAQTQETIADIIAEMNRVDICADGEPCLRDYADRLEAAHKREVDALNEQIADLRQQRDLWSKRSAELVERCNEHYAKIKQVGNAAKLRDALVQVQKKINYLIGNLTVPNSLVANRMEINGIINAALAAPPRNCDVGSAEEQAKEFIKQRGAEVAVSKTETTTPVAVAENATTTQAHLKPLNMAECRSALEAIADSARTGSISTLPSAKLILRTCEKALAAPPRNCDRFNSGNAERDAEMAWDAITSGMDLQFSDLTEREIAIIKEAMRGFVWLFTTADESEAQA